MILGNEWMLEAKCRGAHHEIFFPTSKDDDRFDQAKEICRGCRVKRQCLSLVIDLPEHDDRWGVFGGLDPNERWMKRQKR